MSQFPDVDLIAQAAAAMRERAEAAAADLHCPACTPAVALAVADWLETGANQYSCVDRRPMVAVARAYLGHAEAGS